MTDVGTPQGTPQGWYPDPFGGGLRYWDGVDWTESRRQYSGEEFPPPEDAEDVATESRRRPVLGLAVGVAGIAAVVVSLFLPWARFEAFGESRTENAFEEQLPWPLGGSDLSGSEGDFANGFLYLAVVGLVALLLAGVAWGRRGLGVAVMALGLATAGYVLVTAIRFDDRFSKIAAPDVSLGIGYSLWLCMAGAFVIIIGGGLTLVGRR